MLPPRCRCILQTTQWRTHEPQHKERGSCFSMKLGELSEKRRRKSYRLLVWSSTESLHLTRATGTESIAVRGRIRCFRTQQRAPRREVRLLPISNCRSWKNADRPSIIAFRPSSQRPDTRRSHPVERASTVDDLGRLDASAAGHRGTLRRHSNASVAFMAIGRHLGRWLQCETEQVDRRGRRRSCHKTTESLIAC